MLEEADIADAIQPKAGQETRNDSCSDQDGFEMSADEDDREFDYGDGNEESEEDEEYGEEEMEEDLEDVHHKSANMVKTGTDSESSLEDDLNSQDSACDFQAPSDSSDDQNSSSSGGEEEGEQDQDDSEDSEEFLKKFNEKKE